MSFNRWMVTQAAVHWYHAVLLSSKNELNIDTRNNLDKSQGIMLSGKKSQSQKVTGCLIPFYIIFLKLQIIEIGNVLMIARSLGGGQKC